MQTDESGRSEEEVEEWIERGKDRSQRIVSLTARTGSTSRPDLFSGVVAYTVTAALSSTFRKLYPVSMSTPETGDDSGPEQK
ncbi:hypothetical protein J6590_047750 [Homalodisca vitripennis]|nr:hypothetical protein J6590_047750 [Homalodisca vitripennis]